MRKEILVSIVASTVALAGATYLYLAEDEPPPIQRPSLAEPTPARAERPALEHDEREPVRRKLRPTPSAQLVDRFLAEAAIDAPVAGDSPPPGAGPKPGQTEEEWLREEFALERERQVNDWQAFDNASEDPALAASVSSEIDANMAASLPTLTGLRDYDAQCRGGHCMITVQWDRLVDAQSGIDQLIDHHYQNCTRTIYLTPDELGTEDAPYEQLISMRCQAPSGA